MKNLISNPGTEKETTKLNLFGSLRSDAMVLGGMLALAYLGVATTYVNRDLSHFYWLTMIPVFGTICFSLQWLRARGTEVNRIRLLGTELLHWGGLLIAVELAYTLLSAGGMPRATTGMVTLLLFTLATFLYGVHSDRRFVVVGGFLGISYVVMIYLAAYMWIVLLIAALMVIGAVFMVKRTYSRETAPVTTAPQGADDHLAQMPRG